MYCENFFARLIGEEEYEKNINVLAEENDMHIKDVMGKYNLSQDKYLMYSTVVRHCLKYFTIPEEAKGDNLFVEEFLQIKSICSSEISERKFAPVKEPNKLALRPMDMGFISLVKDIIDCEEEKNSIPVRAKNGAKLPNEYCKPDCLYNTISKAAYEKNLQVGYSAWSKEAKDLIDIYKNKGVDKDVFDDILYVTHIKRNNMYQCAMKEDEYGK